MNKCLNTGNLLTIISQYLSFKDILKLSHCNRSIRNLLNPDKNNIINKIFLLSLIKIFFEFDSDIIFKNKKNLSGKLMKFTKNYKAFMMDLNKNIQRYSNESIRKKVIDCFRIHMYLPDLRKENIHLEFESSSIHLMFCYDMLFRTTCTYNYYNKYITKEYMISGLNEKEGDINNSKVFEIKILREGLYFEKELKDFKNTFNELINNKEYKEILFDLIKYNFKNLDCKYMNMFNNNINNNKYNNLIYLLLWINHLFILYSDFAYYYVRDFKNDTDEKIILTEFVRKHNEIINCALLLNSNFENINIIINNYLIYYSIYDDLNDNKNNLNLSPTSSEASTCSNSSENKFDNTERFSLYKLFFNIIKENVYNRLSEILTEKFKILVKNYCNDLFENYKKSEKKVENVEDNFLELNENGNKNMIIDDDDEISEEDENMEDLIEDQDPGSKEVLESFINCEVDYMIDEKNSNAINHSELKVTEEYKGIEYSLIKQFKETIKYYIKEEKPCSDIFSIIEKITKCNGTQMNLLSSSDSLTLIRRTKKLLMKESFEVLFQKVIEDYKNSFPSHIKTNENNEYVLSLSENEIQNNTEYNCCLKNLTKKSRIKIIEIVEKEIGRLKEILKEECEKKVLSESKKEQMQKLVDEYTNCDGIQEVLLFKKMIWFYYRELGYYEEKNDKIINILKHMNIPQEKNMEKLPYDLKPLLNEPTTKNF